MVQNNNKLVMALCAGLVMSMSSVAFGANQQASAAEGPAWFTRANTIKTGLGLGALSCVVKAVSWLSLPEVATGMTAEAYKNTIEDRVSNVMKCGGYAAVLGAALQSYAWLADGLSSDENATNEVKAQRPMQVLKGTLLGGACLAAVAYVAPAWFGYGFTKLS